jgi:hypothetical protein
MAKEMMTDDDSKHLPVNHDCHFFRSDLRKFQIWNVQNEINFRLWYKLHHVQSTSNVQEHVPEYALP